MLKSTKCYYIFIKNVIAGYSPPFSECVHLPSSLMEIELLAVFCTEIFYYILKKKKDTNNIDPIIKLPLEGDKS